MKIKKITTSLLAISASASLVTLTSCTPAQQTGAGIGAVGGGVIGAFTGDSGDVLKGAAIGAGLGAGSQAIQGR